MGSSPTALEIIGYEEDSLALVHEEDDEKIESHVPLVSSYNDHIRPLLDAVDKLRHLNVTKEGIQLPTIVVVGDQSSGKSSVLESLAGINLPRGQGICTRVPLVMRLQHHPSPTPELFLEFSGKIVATDEAHVADAINIATDEIAGDGKGISNTPLTLVVKKKGVPDLTMVDLPGITRVPVHGQPEDIYEQIAGIIMEYIRPEESIILNVLSATVDFPTCESIRMSRQVDKTGERTLAVVTKSDKAPEGLLEKVTADDLQFSTRRAGHNLISKMKEQSINWIAEIVQMEKMTDYTCSPEYMNEWNKLMGQLDTFKNRILTYGYSKAEIAGIGEVDAGNIREHQNVLHQAFDLKMKMTAYWKIVLRRLVDYMALQLQFSVQNLVNKEMEKEIVSELMSSHGGAVETMLEESPSVAAKREKLNMSIKLLGESKKVLGNIMDKIATYND
ncbi:hypothetical protein MANES_09G183950v8 [Manihot esculenta]|uniref:Uncharacterized protein n=1 Tax=Manihot esculenta TaxID=3983 RepID=A0ACB7H8G8_MANES|nr:hypothetical protein MANES_09G183950v8 [Manihot esculenta]